MKNRDKVLALVGLLVTLGFPALPTGAWYDKYVGKQHLVGYELIWWAVVALVLFYVLLAEKRPLGSIGFRPPGVRDILIGLGGGVVILAGLASIYYVIFPALHVNEDQAINQVAATPFWWRFITVVRAAVAEEIFFRGYAIERTQELTGSVRIAAIVPCAIFALEHVGYWGWWHLLVAGFAGAVLTALYIWRRNLWVTMLAHFVVDGAAFLLG